MNMKETFGAYIRERVPSLWREVTRAKIDAAAVFSWPVARVSALEFRGSKDTPCGCVGGPMLDVVDRISHHLDREAWHGLCPSQQERCGGTEILWVRPHLGDPPGLGVRLSITAASFAGRTYQPRPHWPEGQAYGRVLTEKAAETGDVAAMLRAAQQFGLDDPRDYLGALWQAASRGEHKFIRALVQLVGLDFVGDGYYSWMHAGAATRGHRSVIYAYLNLACHFRHLAGKHSSVGLHRVAGSALHLSGMSFSRESVNRVCIWP